MDEARRKKEEAERKRKEEEEREEMRLKKERDQLEDAFRKEEEGKRRKADDARQANAESLVFAIRTHLLPHQAIVVARDLHKLQRVQDHVVWSSCIAMLENADSATQDKFWRYLQLFCELCNFSESQ